MRTWRPERPNGMRSRAPWDELTPDHRAVQIVLRFYADLPIDQIASRLGERRGTVKSRLHHAIRLLRAAYDAAAKDHPTEAP